jgi:hypothetical protein
VLHVLDTAPRTPEDFAQHRLALHIKRMAQIVAQQEKIMAVG